METRIWRREIAEEIDRTLRAAASLNETKLACIRAAVVGVSAAIDVVVYFHPSSLLGVDSVPPEIAIFSSVWATLALTLAFVLLSGGYRSWMRVAIPVFDGAMVCVLFFNLWRVLAAIQPHFPAIVANIAAVSILLAATGGVRLSRSAAALTTTVALADFLVIAWVSGLSAAMAAFVSVILLGMGLLAGWMTVIVRRQVELEVGRAVLGRFLPRRVVDEAHASPLSLLTEPRSVDVSIVVTDLRDFTRIAETMSPANVLAFLNLIHGRQAEIVEKHGGTVDKFLGDGMLAVFGAPEPLEDHAAFAIRAARDILADLEAIHRDRAPEAGPPVRMGIGIHSGSVVVGCLGSGTRVEFTVIGDTVNTASRLQELTKEKGVSLLVSAETLRRAALRDPEGAPRARSQGMVPIRGRSEPLELFALET